MLAPELVKKIRQIEIRTRRLVDESFGGSYQAVFKGQGMEFAEVRPYTPGDEVRNIDWNVTARMGQPFIKRFVEERELTVMLLFDASASGDFGSRARFKRELAAELAAVLAFSAGSNNDKVGLLIFSDRVEQFVPPRKGRRHILRLVRDLLVFQPAGRGTDIGLALQSAMNILKRHSILFLLSDFQSEPDTYRKAFFTANRRHDLVAVELCDPLEEHIPPDGLLTLEDLESEEIHCVDTASIHWQNAFHQQMQQNLSRQKSLFVQAGVDHIRVLTGEDYIGALSSFFRRRKKRLNR